MDGTNRRAFLRLSAAVLAAAVARARAGPCEPDALAFRPDRRVLAIFLEDSTALQGLRLNEFRARLAAQGLGEERLRFESILVEPTEADGVRCPVENALRHKPMVLCTASTAAALRAMPFAGRVPLVFATRGDPVSLGLVDSIGPRAANTAGFTYDTPVAFDRKCFELIAEAYPGTRRVLVLADRDWGARAGREGDLRLVSERFGYGVVQVVTTLPGGIVDELQRIVPRPNDACYVPRTDLMLHGSVPIMNFLHRHKLPHLYADDRPIRSGGLMSYGPPRLAHWDAMAAIVRQIAAGVRAADIPVQRPFEFHLWVNVAQWQRFGIPLPRRILRRAHTVV